MVGMPKCSFVKDSNKVIACRIMLTSFNGNPELTIISAHAPHGAYNLEVRRTFFKKLTETIQQIPTHNIIIVAADLNAQVGHDLLTNYSKHFGPHCYYPHTKKDSNGMLTAELCNAANMICLTTFFQHPASKLWTHTRPTGIKEQLDHLLVNAK